MLLALHDDVCWNGREADRRLCFVHVLAAGTAGPHHVGAYVIFVDIDLDAIVDHRKHDDAGKGSVTPRVGIEWRNAHQPMHAVFTLEPPICVMALDHDGRRLDPGTLALTLFDPVDFVTVRFRPTNIHAHEHTSPILAFGATSTGVNFKVAVVGVGIARQEHL